MNTPDLARLRGVIALSAAYLFMIGVGWGNAAIHLGIVVLIAMTVADGRSFWRWARTSPAFWTVIGLSAYLLLRAQFAGPVPVSPDERGSELKNLLGIAGIPALALGWWCARNPGHLVALITVAALGLVLGVLVHLDWSRLDDYLRLQERLQIHLGGNGTSVFGGALLLGTLLVGSSLAKSGSPGWRFPGWWLFPAALLFLFGLELLLTGQTRTAWVAVAVTLLVMGVVSLHGLGVRGLVRSISNNRILLVLSVSGVVLLLLLVWEPIVARFSRELSTWGDIAQLRFEEVKQTSIGLRITAWRIGLDAFADNPWFGTGLGSASEVMQHSDIHIRKILSHFHSLYVHVLVTTGVVGFALGTAMIVSSTREALLGASTDWHSGLMARFAGVSAIYFGIVSLAVIRFDDPNGMAYMILVTAFAVAPGMRRSLDECRATPE